MNTPKFAPTITCKCGHTAALCGPQQGVVRNGTGIDTYYFPVYQCVDGCETSTGDLSQAVDESGAAYVKPEKVAQ